MVGPELGSNRNDDDGPNIEAVMQNLCPFCLIRTTIGVADGIQNEDLSPQGKHNGSTATRMLVMMLATAE